MRCISRPNNSTRPCECLREKYGVASKLRKFDSLAFPRLRSRPESFRGFTFYLGPPSSSIPRLFEKKAPALTFAFFSLSFFSCRLKLSPYRSFEIRILVRIRRRAATEKAQRLFSHDRVPRTGRDEDRVARADHSTFAVEFYLVPD